MSAHGERKLVPRGAPVESAMMKSKQHNLLHPGERNDSGFSDSFKSERSSYESTNESMTLLEEITEKMSIHENTEQLKCVDETTKTRHPQPCTSTTTATTTRMTEEVAQYSVPAHNVLSFAQSNDVRHLLAPYRHHLHLQNDDGDT